MSELDDATLRQLSVLGEEALGQIIERYALDARARIKELGEALRSEDADRAGSLLHALKGASLTVGARGTAELCKDGEERAREMDWAALSADFRARLEASADRSVAALRRRLTPKS